MHNVDVHWLLTQRLTASEGHVNAIELLVCLFVYLPCCMLQGYNYEHLGGDLNEKLTDGARTALDEAWNTVMEDFREAKRPSLKFSHDFSSPSMIVLNSLFVAQQKNALLFALNLGEGNVESKSDREKTLINSYGKMLFEEYMKVLDDPTCFRTTMEKCYMRGHKASQRDVLFCLVFSFMHKSARSDAKVEYSCCVFGLCL